MKSVLQKNKKCFECGCTGNLECHHVFYGRAYRNKSERYGMKVWLCAEHHRGKNGVHGGNRALGLRIMRYAQRRFEQRHTREEFMRIFGRNRLDDETTEGDIGKQEGKKASDGGNSFGDDSNVRGWDC